MTVTETLRKIIQEVVACTTLEESLSTLLNHLVSQFECNAASIFFCDDEKGEYVLASHCGFDCELTESLRLPYGEGVLGLIAEREEIISLENFASHPAFVFRKTYPDNEYKGYVGFPIIFAGNVLAVASLYREDERLFSEKTLSMCFTLSVSLASWLAQAYVRGQVPQVKKGKRQERVYTGQPGSPGVGIGIAHVVFPEADLDAVPDQPAGDIKDQIARFEQALTLAREEMSKLQQQAKETLSAAESAIFDAYLRILDSRTFSNQVMAIIESDQWAEGALRCVVKKQVSQFESLEDPYLRDRAGDFLDLGQRILFFLQKGERGSVVYPDEVILVGQEVTATALMGVPKGQLVGIVSAAGSSNSHVAILARAMGVPAVMGMQNIKLTKLQHESIIVDGYNGQMYCSPSRQVSKEFKTFAKEEVELDAELSSLRDQPAQTTDGCRFKLYMNTGLAVQGSAALQEGAEGIGLYRTEMPFMMTDRFPSENEQYRMYRRVLNSFHPRPVYMRTLDMGGDKPLPYFQWEEENPALGWRGVRVTLDHPEIFLQQVRAMMRANEGLGNLSIILPMITSLQEVDHCLRLIIQAHEELQAEGLKDPLPAIGSMIEVPAAVYQSHEIAKRLDFLSVGSNDLTQYLLAADRNNSQVAKLYDALHPAVLQAMYTTVKSAHRAGRQVGICGELSSDPLGVILLMGMGFDSLSVNARMLLRIKWVVRSFSSEQARAALADALVMDDARDVRLHLEGILDAAGLGGLIRAGR